MTLCKKMAIIVSTPLTLTDRTHHSYREGKGLRNCIREGTDNDGDGGWNAQRWQVFLDQLAEEDWRQEGKGCPNRGCSWNHKDRRRHDQSVGLSQSLPH